MAEDNQHRKRKQGKLIAICSAKGGIGRTLVSVNLAVALSKKNLKVCLVDGDLQFGDVSLALDLQSSFTIQDVAEDMEGMDDHALVNYLSQHTSGVHVLPAPERPEYAELVTSEILKRVLKLLLKQHDYVVVDTAIGLQEQTIDVLELADEVIMLTNLEMTTLKNSKLMIETLEQLELREKVQLIINQYNIDSLINIDDATKMLGERRAISIANNPKIAIHSINVGIPFVIGQGKSDLSKAIFKMAESLISTKEFALEKRKKRSILKNVFGH
ncbi:pilus assembly protein CpaE [Evansella vedderi]|uniref:Pilus assembly protein CpaE n=1 Tax=Evansella vedderi TaxID=38282 RepID=A0ABU0A0G5_9BACI|nr:AAA family ATPase [Evansella vedderi]MDQ0256983.1 pilus assembly protein CpaE [Evansella vedderi]